MDNIIIMSVVYLILLFTSKNEGNENQVSEIPKEYACMIFCLS